jgi:penicillin-binding protein 2
MDGMNGVSNEPGGTAYGSRIADLGPLTLAGKTGSAQVRRITMAERATGVIKNDDLPWEQRDHALFVCFAPVIAPRYAMCVVIEHGGSGSHAAAPVARDIMREVLIRDPASKKPLAPIARAETRSKVG